MNQVWVVFLTKLRIAGHEIAGVRHQSKLKVGVISVAALLLWVGGFFLFYEGFRWLMVFGGGPSTEFNFSDLLMARLLSILSLTVFLLLVFSNVLVAFSTLYRSKEVVYLLQGPIRYDHFFYARFFECVAFSSWALVFIGSPLMLAYGINTAAPWYFYVALLLFFLPFILIPAALGAVITIVLVRILPRLKIWHIILLALGAAGLFFSYIFHVLRGTRLTDEHIIPVFLKASGQAQGWLLPSHWASQGVLAAARYQHGESLFWFLLLCSTALVTLLLAGRLAQHHFFPGYSFLAGQDRQRIRPREKGLLNRFEQFLFFVPEPYRSLTVKDVKLFWREPTQWSQFVIFFGIMAVYIANLKSTSRYYEDAMWRSWIACLNVGSVTLILSTLTSRFVFPLVSLEGRRFWIIGLAPFSFTSLVWQKFWLSVFATSFFTVGLAFLSATMLQLEPVFFWMTVYSVVVANFGLAGLAVGLGALYPSFHEDNPARIVSGLGGTLNLLLSIAYITVIIAAQTIVLQWNALGGFVSPALFRYALTAAVAVGLAATALAVGVPMYLGLRNLRDREY
ncbi:MAG: hypothetical protein GX130_14405 [Candidatus Hydrogenedens sp.]|jgi:ABC-2 type transport system permease protein|nr:hypothetical protein [Candidatus Hydrogenedens sp.]